MDKKGNQYYIIDFDSTFIKSEGLDELASFVLANNPQKEKIIEKIKDITKKGMRGEIPFDKSLRERISLLTPSQKNVEELGKYLKKHISKSIARNKKFFKIYKEYIYIISGGFKEYILPVVESFNINEDHVYANTFNFDKNGNFIGYDTKNPLAQEDGKVKLVKSLNLQGDIFVIGDGYTDYKLKELGLVKKFIAFTENIERDVVVSKADQVASSFDEFLYINKLPMTLSYPKNRLKVMLLENIDKSAVKIFEKEGYEVEYFEKSLAEDDLLKKIEGISILGVRSRTQITEKLLQHAQRLLLVGGYIIGTNNIDLSACSKKGVSVFNAPYGSTRSVAELIIGEIIMLSRGVFEKSNKAHAGVWDKSFRGYHEIRGKTLGIIGYGNIGSNISVLAESLGMKVLFYDILDKLVLGNAQKCNTLEELLRKADIITVHVDGNPQNKDFIGNKEFSLMKDGVIFLNASRGFVVDISALTANLKIGKIAQAAIDVFPKEPKSKDEKFVSELQQFPNVILTPHIGAGSEEAQRNIADFVSAKIIEYINTGNTYLSVNMPNIQAAKQNQTHRLLHIHKNVPGILAQINGLLAENNINIVGQYLKTNNEIGYVITDVNKKYDEAVLGKIKKIPNTIRFRVLY